MFEQGKDYYSLRGSEMSHIQDIAMLEFLFAPISFHNPGVFIDLSLA